MVQGRPTEKACELLASSLLVLFGTGGETQINQCGVFVSQQEFHFPNDQAARVAVDTVKISWQAQKWNKGDF